MSTKPKLLKKDRTKKNPVKRNICSNNSNGYIQKCNVFIVLLFIIISYLMYNLLDIILA